MVYFLGNRIGDVADHHQGPGPEKGVQAGGLGIGDHQHVAFVDLLPGRDGGAVKTHTIGKNGLVELAHRGGEVMPGPLDIDKAIIDVLDVLIYNATDEVGRCHVYSFL
ncbi:hypothetical protein ES703_118651 [subsurface metagenome]